MDKESIQIILFTGRKRKTAYIVDKIHGKIWNKGYNFLLTGDIETSVDY